MKSFIEQAQLYAACHQKPMTRYSHYIGIPLIIFSLLILLGFLHLVIPGVMNITFASIATAALLVYYFSLNWRLALVLTPILIILLTLADWVSQDGPTAMALWIFVFTFLVGWVFQLVGHFIEGRRPAFLENCWQPLIAPLFLTAELFFLAGRMQVLKEEIYGKPSELETPSFPGDPKNRL